MCGHNEQERNEKNKYWKNLLKADGSPPGEKCNY
jgi:hypothetical protein